jgi:hypothetical protein
MGKDLHYSIIEFFEENVNKHRDVLSIERLEEYSEYYTYRIHRKRMLNDIIVILSDEYYYTLDHWYGKPSCLENNSFIYIARPESLYDNQIVDLAKDEKISIGKFGALLGALSQKRLWEYIPPERRKKSSNN